MSLRTSLFIPALIVLGCFMGIRDLHAMPVRYVVTFDGSGTGTPGSGFLEWDHDTLSMSYLRWDFGPGREGAFDDERLAFGNLGQILAVIFQLETETPEVSASSADGSVALTSVAVDGPYPDIWRVCGGPSMTLCGMPAGPIGEVAYLLTSSMGDSQGRLFLEPAVVSEPAALSMALLALGSAWSIQRGRRNRRSCRRSATSSVPMTWYQGLDVRAPDHGPS